jgi:hypothetical protein
MCNGSRKLGGNRIGQPLLKLSIRTFAFCQGALRSVLDILGIYLAPTSGDALDGCNFWPKESQISKLGRIRPKSANYAKFWQNTKHKKIMTLFAEFWHYFNKTKVQQTQHHDNTKNTTNHGASTIVAPCEPIGGRPDHPATLGAHVSLGSPGA